METFDEIFSLLDQYIQDRSQANQAVTVYNSCLRALNEDWNRSGISFYISDTLREHKWLQNSRETTCIILCLELLPCAIEDLYKEEIEDYKLRLYDFRFELKYIYTKLIKSSLWII